MYQSHFGLREKPFNVGPDPRFLFLADSHRDAAAYLRYAITERAGFAVLAGEVGVGKTMLVRSLATELAGTTNIAFILSTRLSFKQLLVLALHDLGLPWRGNKAELLLGLQEFLAAETARGRTTALVVDEAHNLTPAVLEEVRMLSNLEADGAKLLQIVLVGQPELLSLLHLRELRQLRQRIPGTALLTALTPDEVARYMDYRLRIAGATRPVFEPEAVAAIAQVTAGIPRLVNLLCERALVFAYGAHQPTVTEAVARDAARDLAPSLDSWLTLEAAAGGAA